MFILINVENVFFYYNVQYNNLCDKMFIVIKFILYLFYFVGNNFDRLLILKK